jgi:class 3 adenylate cyclase
MGLEIRAMAASGQDRIERRLAAILAADVAGYSRLTGVDEEGTHVQLQDHLRALVDPKIAEHRCACRKSHPAILMVQSAQDRAADDIPGPLNAARDRGILVQ